MLKTFKEPKQNNNWKYIAIFCILVLVLFGIGYLNKGYVKYIETRTETNIAKAQTQTLNFLWYDHINNKTTVVTAQQLYFYFQQLEQQQQ